MPKRSWTEHAGLMLHLGRACLSGLWTLEARLKGASVGRGVIFFGRPIISMAKGSKFELRDEVKIGSSRRANVLGCFQPSVLRTLCPGAELVLETNVGISGCVLCAAKSIVIGQGTNIGSGAMVIDNDFHVPAGDFGWADGCEKTARPVIIGKGVFIGARAIVLKGVSIGDRAVVGAGTVVTKPVPPRHFAVGNPARIFPIRDDYFEKHSASR